MRAFGPQDAELLSVGDKMPTDPGGLDNWAGI